jgi:MerR family transcriptional regulator, light-induced transcriptional regulator
VDGAAVESDEISVENVDEPRLTVSGAARRLGVAPATLRTWDRRYGIGPSGHAHGHHRRYSSADMARLELMQHALVQGAAPAEAARYARAAVLPPDIANGSQAGTASSPSRPLETPVAPARPDLGPVPVVATDSVADPSFEAPGPSERPIRAGGGTLRMPGAGPRARGLGRAALAMDPIAVRRIMEESIAKDGVVATWDDVARPVLSAVGQRWAASGRGVEVEHLLSECLIAVFGARANAMVGAEAAGRATRPVLLAGMPSELHVVPLAVLAAVLVERGVGCRSLGPALPAAALSAAIRRTLPAAVVLWSQLRPTADAAVVEALPVTRPRFLTYVAGPGWADVALLPGVSWLASLTAAREQISAAVLR